MLGTLLGASDSTTIIETLEAWFVADGSTTKAGKLLHCHRNTVGYRLGRVAELTGRSVSRRCGIASFKPRLMLPLSMSYDHRVIDGALAARFTRHLAHVLEDVRRLIL